MHRVLFVYATYITVGKLPSGVIVSKQHDKRLSVESYVSKHVEKLIQKIRTKIRL